MDVLERRVAELATQLSACESRSDEDRRGRIATAGRLERKVVDLEGQLAAERQRVEHEGELREQASQELGREKDHAALAMAEHLRVVRDGATASVQLAQVTERCSGHERETERLKERAVELEERLDATKQKGEQVKGQYTLSVHVCDYRVGVRSFNLILVGSILVFCFTFFGHSMVLSFRHLPPCSSLPSLPLHRSHHHFHHEPS